MRGLKLIACLMAALSASCVTNGPVPLNVIDTSCQWVRPIYIGREDVLTEQTARQILAHNKAWKSTCGSTQPTK